MNSFLLDLRFALRMLSRNPGLTLSALLTIGLGVGANTAIFSVVRAVLLRPLPYQEPERLVQLYQNVQRLGLSRMPLSLPEFLDYRAHNRVFERVASFQHQSFTWGGSHEPEQIQGGNVSVELFPLLGTGAALGRTFGTDENEPGAARVVILGDGLWRRRLGADPGILGQTVTLNNQNFSVVGVMPPGFRFPAEGAAVELWVPTPFTPDELNRRNTRNYSLFARLRPGVGLEQAQSEVSAIVGRFEGSVPGLGAYLVPLHEVVTGRAREGFLLLLGAVSFVLLIACANVANLLLARATGRHREVAVRMALGAGRSRLVRQLLTESVLLGLLGGAVGLGLAFWSLDLVVSLNPPNVPRIRETRIDFAVFGFALALSSVTGLVFGLIPALTATRSNLSETLKEDALATTTGLGRRNLRGALVIAEVALALVLAVAAVLLVRSFLRLSSVGPGFHPGNLLTLGISLPESRYPDRARRALFFREVAGRVSALPGVVAAGFVNAVPFGRSNADFGFTVMDQPPRDRSDFQSANWRLASPGYFRAMGISVLKGRVFAEVDDENAPGVAIINETMARRFWPAADPIGRQIRLGGPDSANPAMSIVGVVGDVKHTRLDEPPRLEIYQPYTQAPRIPLFQFQPMTLVVKTQSEPVALAPALRNAIWAVDKAQPVTNVITMEQLLASSVAQNRSSTILLGIFAGMALVLAAVGIYGVMSYSVAQRTREIGIRMALGADRGDVLKMVVKEGLILAGAGLLIGVGAAFGTTRYLAHLLVGVSASDPVTFAGTPLFLGLVTVAASYLPAWRATRVDPLAALRQDVSAAWGRVPGRADEIRRKLANALARNRAGETDRSVLSDLALSTRSVTSLDELFDRVLSGLREFLQASRIFILVRGDKVEAYSCVASSVEEGSPDHRAIQPVLAPESFVLRRLRRLALPLDVGEADFEAWERALAGAKRDALKARRRDIETLRSMGACLVQQIMMKGELVGVIVLGKRLDGRIYSDRDRSLLTAVAGQMAFIIENARLVRRIAEEERLQAELDMATEVQRRLFPERAPLSPSFELVGFCQPARGVGGDYYDFLDLKDGKVGVALADVSGKGISAALLMSIVQASLRSQTASGLEALSEIVGTMNRLLHKCTDAGRYATFFYAVLDAASETLTYINAGHNAPLLVKARRSPPQSTDESAARLAPLAEGGPVLGIFPDCSYTAHSLSFEPGDLLVAYSDGITEALSPEGEEFGEARLEAILEAAVDVSAEELQAVILESVRTWCRDAQQHDDMTLVVVKVSG